MSTFFFVRKEKKKEDEQFVDATLWTIKNINIYDSYQRIKAAKIIAIYFKMNTICKMKIKIFAKNSFLSKSIHKKMERKKTLAKLKKKRYSIDLGHHQWNGLFPIFSGLKKCIRMQNDKKADQYKKFLSLKVNEW